MGTSGGDEAGPLGPDGEPPGPGEFPGDPSEFAREDAMLSWTISPGSVADRLLRRGNHFDFFQAVRLLHAIRPDHEPVGRDAKPRHEVVWFSAHQSMSFPASAIQEIRFREDIRGPSGASILAVPSAPAHPPALLPVLSQNFLGLTGPSGVLPTHYTELLIQNRAAAGPLLDWLDLFNHRLTSFFFRTWEKYRPYPAFERGEAFGPRADPFTRSLLGLLGLGFPSLRNRVVTRLPLARSTDERPATRPREFGDFLLMHYAGLLSRRPANVVSLEQVIGDYFGVPVAVEQFVAEWVQIAEGEQTRLSLEEEGGLNNQLGVSAVIGERFFDAQGKFRLRIGPVDYRQFVDFFPTVEDHSLSNRPLPSLFRLVRFYVGPELGFEVQIVIKKEEVPPCRLALDDTQEVGARLGWNTWLTNEPLAEDASDTSFTDDFPTS